MNFTFINKKNETLNEKLLEKYVKKELKNKLKKCNFKEFFVEPIMEEITDYFDKGGKGNQELSLSRIFRKYQDNCDCSTEDLINTGRSNGVVRYGNNFDYDEICLITDEFLSIFFDSNIFKYDITKGTTLLTYFNNGLEQRFMNYKKEKEKNDSKFVDIDSHISEDSNSTYEDKISSGELTLDEIMEIEEMKKEAMEIAREILNNPKIVTRKSLEVLLAYTRATKVKRDVDLKDIDKQLGKKPGSVSKNLKDLGNRINDCLEDNYYDFIHEPDGKTLVINSFGEELNNMV